MSRRKKGDLVDGWVCLDKPLDLTSTAAVSRVRRLFNAQKAGHAGTLDPLATGVLPIALGEATKTVPYLVSADKTYRFTVNWGTTTASYDRESPAIARSDVRPSPEQVVAALPRFVGEIDQTPPNFSAIRVNGARAYDLAREGVEMVLEPRRVRIDSAVVVAAPDADHVEIEIRCGKGTYVRAIARDLAEALGACGHVSALRRTRVGAFEAGTAVTLEQLADLCSKRGERTALLPVETALDDIPACAVTAEDAFRLKQGRAIVLLPRQVEMLRPRFLLRSERGEDRTVSAMSEGKVVALCEMRAGRLNPTRVFHPSTPDPKEVPDVDNG